MAESVQIQAAADLQVFGNRAYAISDHSFHAFSCP
jgi:hypothetical protein